MYRARLPRFADELDGRLYAALPAETLERARRGPIDRAGEIRERRREGTLVAGSAGSRHFITMSAAMRISAYTPTPLVSMCWRGSAHSLRQHRRDRRPEVQHDCGSTLRRLRFRTVWSLQELVDGLLHHSQRCIALQAGGRRSPEIQAGDARATLVVVQMQRDEKFRPFGGQSLGELRLVIVQQAGAQALGLAVDDVENLHLLALREADEAHEGQGDRQVVEVAQPMLAIDLGQDLSRERADGYGRRISGRYHAPLRGAKCAGARVLY